MCCLTVREHKLAHAIDSSFIIDPFNGEVSGVCFIMVELGIWLDLLRNNVKLIVQAYRTVHTLFSILFFYYFVICFRNLSIS